MMSGVSGVVLAGGESRRMGCDKALLTIGGLTMLEHQVRKLRCLGVDDVMISGRREPVDGARCVDDIMPGCGPLGGLYVCLAAAVHANCLVLSVDVPLAPPDALRRLIEAQSRSGCEATLLEHGGFREPLIAVYRASLARKAGELLARGERAVRALLQGVSCASVAYDGPEILLTNCNTADDYRLICRLADGIGQDGSGSP